MGLDAAEKKFGQGKIDPQKQRGMNEKITDGARRMLEKATVCDFLFIACFTGDRTTMGMRFVEGFWGVIL